MEINGIIEIGIVVLLLALYGLSAKSFFFRKCLIFVYILTMVVYIGWRAFYTIPSSDGVSLLLGVLLLVAEVGGFFLSLVFYFLFFKKNKKPIRTLAALEKQYPTVDVFIATYNEDPLILKRAILAAKTMRYPLPEKVHVYVLDDGGRPAVEALALELNVGYLKRDTHEHAKAGNMNNALGKTAGELVVTMDADMVPRGDFLEKTIGYFGDEKVGFVQSPQTFFNDDPYQFNLYARDYLNNDQDFFMRRIEEQKDIFNATMYIGSNAVFRRKALDEIGGFTTGVITEDMATGMFIQAKGWETRFVNENLASGLAPETFGDLIKQRDRWARGNIQVARKFNPLRLKGLNTIQKILYVDGIHYWFSGMYKMIYLLAPIWFLLFGFNSLDTTLEGILYFWLPAFLASQLAFNRVSQGKQTVMITNIYETVMAPFMAYAVIGEAVFKAKNKFVVTNKGKNSSKSYYNWRIATPVLILWGLSLVAVIKSVLILTDVWTFSLPKQTLYINLFWLLYNLIALTFAAVLPFERPRFRKAERFPSTLAMELFSLEDQRLVSGTILDWNELSAGVRLEKGQTASIKEGQAVRLHVLDQVIPATVFRFHRAGGQSLSLKFTDLSEAEYAFLIRQTYAQDSTEVPLEDKKNRIGNLVYAFFIQRGRSRRKKSKKQ